MNLNDVWKISLLLIVSLGGFSGILTLIIQFSSNIIADRLSQKYQLKMNRKFESYKKNLDKKTYISKVRFDKEFEIYQELSEKVLTMVFKFAELARAVSLEQEEDEEVIRIVWQAAVESYNEANITTRKFAPFIRKSIYDLFTQLGDKCRNQLNYYCIHYKESYLEREWGSLLAFVNGYTSDYSNFCTEEKFEEKFKFNQQEISESIDELMSTLRTYLSGLDVIMEGSLNG
jgi:hypothetical protein